MTLGEGKPSILAVFEAVGYEVPSFPKDSGWTKISCPIHLDRTPSASINVELGRWQCFTCQLSEDGFDVLIREKNITLPQARAWAESELGVERVYRKGNKGGAKNAKSLWD